MDTGDFVSFVEFPVVKKVGIDLKTSSNKELFGEAKDERKVSCFCFLFLG